MAGAVLRFLTGVIWAISGALMAFNPPPPDIRRAQSLPAVGCVVLLGGIWVAVQAVRTHDLTDTGRPPRHAAPTSRRDRVRTLVSTAVAVPASALMLWWALSAGSRSLLGLAIACLGTTVLAVAARIRYPGLR